MYQKIKYGSGNVQLFNGGFFSAYVESGTLLANGFLLFSNAILYQMIQEEATMTIYGYIRVSTKEQNEDRQVVALAEFDIPEGNLYMDKQSGKDFDRPAYLELVERLEPNDMIIIKSIDRLGRNYEEIQEQWRVITKEKNADIKVIDTPLLDTSYYKDLLGTFIADLVLAVMSYTAQMERDSIRQRQEEGIDAARDRGVRFGRPEASLPENFEFWYDKWMQNEINAREFSESLGVSRSTLYNKIKLYRRLYGFCDNLMFDALHFDDIEIM